MWDNPNLLRTMANALFALCGLAGVYGIASYLMNLPGLFPVRAVYLVTAPQKVMVNEVLAVARHEVRGNLLTVDIERIRQSLERLPWVRHVNIRREFPDRLAVQLEEHRVLARWNDSSLVNIQGEVFNAASDEEMPNFIGQTGDSGKITQHYEQFTRRLAELDLQIHQLSLSPRHAWQLHLSNGLVLELGREDITQRLERFVATYPYGLAEQVGLRYVDMRYRSGFAVRRTETDGRTGYEG